MLVDRLVERPRDIRIGLTQKSDVAVADLGESQSGPARTARGVGGAGDVRDDFAADHRQADGSAEPCAVPDQLAPVHRVRLVGHCVTTTVACMYGWIEQTYSNVPGFAKV